MKLLLALFCAFGGYIFNSEAATNTFGQKFSLDSDLNGGDSNSRIIQEGDTFKCPFPMGSFSHPEDCNKYYFCVAGMAIKRECKKGNKFDFFRRVCLPGFMAFCFNKDKKTTDETPTETTSGIVPEGRFKCPSFKGWYPHPGDCSKYYTCMFYMASEKTCPENELFDAVQSSCRPAHEVQCGNRQRPGHLTTEDISENTNTDATTDPDTETEGITDPDTETEGITDPDTETEDITETETEVIDISTDASTFSPVTKPKDITTTEKHRETGPPETDCDEDDADCIMDETGDPDDWFKCPDDVGSYRHPSSKKLFIFCMNWIPSVKKCGMELIFSEELSTCIDSNSTEEIEVNSTEEIN